MTPDAERLDLMLGVLESVVRDELKAARVKGRARGLNPTEVKYLIGVQHLRDARRHVAAALAEGARPSPDRARIALDYAAAEICRRAAAVEDAQRVAEGRAKGQQASKAKRRRRTNRVHSRIRARAAALGGTNKSEKARKLAREFPKKSKRQIRRIISAPPKK